MIAEQQSLWPPHITVAAVIEDAGKFLMVKEQVDQQVVYNQPAGHWEESETLIEASIRETLEETGWLYQPTAIVGIYLFKAPNGITYQRICFTGILQEFKDTILDADIISAEWLSREQLTAISHLHRSPLVQCCIDDYLAQVRYPLHLINDLRL